MGGWWLALTKLLLDDCKNLLPAELCRDALNSGQGLTSISLCCKCRQRVSRSLGKGMANTIWGSVGSVTVARERYQPCFSLLRGEAVRDARTLNPNMDIIRSLGLFSSVLVGFGEGVCKG